VLALAALDPRSAPPAAQNSVFERVVCKVLHAVLRPGTRHSVRLLTERRMRIAEYQAEKHWAVEALEYAFGQRQVRDGPVGWCGVRP
jgi:hypothetical protein